MLQVSRPYHPSVTGVTHAVRAIDVAVVSYRGRPSCPGRPIELSLASRTNRQPCTFLSSRAESAGPVACWRRLRDEPHRNPQSWHPLPPCHRWSESRSEVTAYEFTPSISGVRSSWRDTADLVVEQQLARARRVALTERPYAQPWREYLLSIGGKDREFLDLIESASQQLITK